MFEKHEIKSRGTGFECITHNAGCCETPEDTHLLGRVNNACLHGRHVKKQTILCKVCRRTFARLEYIKESDLHSVIQMARSH